MSGKLHGNEESLTAEHAVLLRHIPNLNSLDYIKAVAAVIGSHQIHSIFDTDQVVKIYLKHKRLVRVVIESGVAVKGCQVLPNFNVPPGSKVILANVDPVVPNWSLECVLSFYGTLESAIMREKICNEAAFSHIEGSSRFVYMNILNDKKLPNKLPLFYGDALYEIEINVEESKKSTSL